MFSSVATDFGPSTIIIFNVIGKKNDQTLVSGSTDNAGNLVNLVSVIIRLPSSLHRGVCVCSDSHNDVPRVAQRYGTIAAHTRRRASVLVVFVVFCVHMHSFAGLIRRTPPPTFSDTALTDRHSDTTIFQLRAHWVRISWSVGSEKSFGHVPPVGVELSTSCMQGEHPIH